MNNGWHYSMMIFSNLWSLEHEIIQCNPLFSFELTISANVQIIWSKEDSQKTQIAIGTLVVAPEYVNRATVNVDNTGSTLHIGIAKSEDAGKYKCSVAVQGDQPTLKHEVRIRGT